MAHKTLINGTAYEITAGKTLVDGTGYNISGGKTLVGGTAYDISFGIDPVELFGKAVVQNVNGHSNATAQLANYSFPSGLSGDCYILCLCNGDISINRVTVGASGNDELYHRNNGYGSVFCTGSNVYNQYGGSNYYATFGTTIACLTFPEYSHGTVTSTIKKMQWRASAGVNNGDSSVSTYAGISLDDISGGDIIISGYSSYFAISKVTDATTGAVQVLAGVPYSQNCKSMTCVTGGKIWCSRDGSKLSSYGETIHVIKGG